VIPAERTQSDLRPRPLGKDAICRNNGGGGIEPAKRFRSGLPPNIKIGQLRRTVPIVPANEWSSLTRDERDAANAITLHVWKRTRQKRHPAFDGDETFLTNRHVQRLLKAVNASNTGEKAARNALAAMQKHGWIVDTGRTKKPRRPPASIERAEAFGPQVVTRPKVDATPSRASAVVLVASVPSPGTHQSLECVEAAGGVPDIQSRAALPSVSVGIPSQSRRDHEAKAPL
jgi:hypothetical protein